MEHSAKYAWPDDKEVAFAIRDDDISYFTQPWMLEELYKDAWRLGFKISLAATPKVKAVDRLYVPRSFRGTNRFFPISKNKELVDYLLEKTAKGQVDIAQHGYTHARECGKPEFAINNFKLINERLVIGNRLLRETFKRDVTVFVAPHEGISGTAWKSLSRNGMFLCRRFTLGRFLMTAPFFSLNLGSLLRIIIHSPNPFKPIPDSVIQLADMLVIQWDAFLWSRSHKNVTLQLEEAKNRFLKRLYAKGVFVLLQHHWDYFNDYESGFIKQDMLTCFKKFLNFVSSYKGVWKTTLSELCSWITLYRA